MSGFSKTRFSVFNVLFSEFEHLLLTRKFKKYNCCNFLRFFSNKTAKKDKKKHKKNKKKPTTGKCLRTRGRLVLNGREHKPRRRQKKGSSRGPMSRARWESLVSWRTWLFSHGARREATMESLIAPFSTHTSRLVPLARRLLCAASRELLRKAAAAQREPEPSFTRSHEPNDSGLYVRGRFEISDNKM